MNYKITAFFVLVLFFTAFGFAADRSKYELRDGELYAITADGQATLIENIESEKTLIGTDTLYWCGIPAEQNKNHPGIYFFHKNGKNIGFLPFEGAEFCVAVRFSPDGRYVLLDTGTWVVRTLHIYTFQYTGRFADFKAQTMLSAIGNYAWLDSDRLVYTSVDDAKPRHRDTDFTGRCSVNLYYAGSHRNVVMEKATDTADFHFQSVEKQNIIIRKEWVEKKSDWIHHDKIKIQQLQKSFVAVKTEPVQNNPASSANRKSTTSATSGQTKSGERSKHTNRYIRKAQDVQQTIKDKYRDF